MNYRILSKEMQDKEVKMLMSMLVPGSSICRVERLYDVNGIDVYFTKGESERQCMLTFYPDELDECQFFIPAENTTLYTVYNFLNGYSTFWNSVSVGKGAEKVFKHEMPVLDEVIGLREQQFLEKDGLKNLSLRCGEVWNRIVHYSMTSNDCLKEDAALLEELDDTFHKEFRKYFYVQGLADAYHALRLFGLLNLE